MNRFMALVRRHHLLIWEMTRRDLLDRYVGQVLGSVWVIGHPIFLMLLYAFIFNFIFPARLGDSYAMPRDLTTYILAGLIPWLTFQDVLARATTAVSSNRNLVKQIVFPVEILPVKTVLAGLPTLLVTTLFLAFYTLTQENALPWTYTLIPLVWLALVTHMVATAYLLSGIGVFIRDIKDLVTVFSSANLFMTPILLHPGVLPPFAERLLLLNPFSYMVWCFQDVFYFGRIEHPMSWLLFLGSAPLMLGLSLSLFTRLKLAFGDRL
jgi:lipopolysaccharide transport system permease protein